MDREQLSRFAWKRLRKEESFLLARALGASSSARKIEIK